MFVLWTAMICYLIAAMVCNLALLSFYREDKNSPNSPWSGSEVCDKIGMVIATMIWPVCIGYGFFKVYIKKEK